MNTNTRIAKAWKNMDVISRALSVCLVACGFLLLAAVLGGKSRAFFAALIQIVLLIYVFQAYRKQIEPNKLWMPIMAIVVVMLLFPAALSTFNRGIKSENASRHYETQFSRQLVWPQESWINEIPKPKSHNGNITYLERNMVCIHVENTTKDDFNKYIEECEAKGFVLNESVSKNTIKATNENGLFVTINYYSNNVMTIMLTKTTFGVELQFEYVPDETICNYDVKILINENEIGILKSGEKDVFRTQLKAGTYTLAVQSSTNENVISSITLPVTDDISEKYKVFCSNEGIKIDLSGIDYETEEDDVIEINHSSSYYKGKNYKRVVSELQKLGFTEIKTRAKYDLLIDKQAVDSIVKITIDGESFDKGDWFWKDDEVIVTYHDYIANDPKYQNSSKNEDEKSNNSEWTNPFYDSLPIIKGTNLDTVMDLASTFGVSNIRTVFSLRDGVKIIRIDNKGNGLELEIVYDRYSKEILSACIFTDELVNKKTAQEFIKCIAKVTCPKEDVKTISLWVDANMGKTAQKEIDGTYYNLDVDNKNNLIYYAGYYNFENWEYMSHP